MLRGEVIPASKLPDRKLRVNPWDEHQVKTIILHEIKPQSPLIFLLVKPFTADEIPFDAFNPDL